MRYTYVASVEPGKAREKYGHRQSTPNEVCKMKIHQMKFRQMYWTKKVDQKSFPLPQKKVSHKEFRKHKFLQITKISLFMKLLKCLFS